VLGRTSCERVLVAALGGVGLLGEINELLARLHSAQVARARVAVVVPIKRGKAEVARQLVDEGPPFGLEDVGLERHHVFVGEREAIFLFEGERARSGSRSAARNRRRARSRRRAHASSRRLPRARPSGRRPVAHSTSRRRPSCPPRPRRPARSPGEARRDGRPRSPRARPRPGSRTAGAGH
jgi:hypothetical protein